MVVVLALRQGRANESGEKERERQVSSVRSLGGLKPQFAYQPQEVANSALLLTVFTGRFGLVYPASQREICARFDHPVSVCFVMQNALGRNKTQFK